MLKLEEGMHFSLGYEGIDQFLAQAPESPMSKNQFYDRLKALRAEGDDAFDVLNSVRVPISARKSLPPDSFEVRDGKLIAKDEKNNEFEIPLTETQRIRNVINNIARQYADLKKPISDEKKKTEALTLTARNKELAEAKPAPDRSLETPHGEALLFAVTALKHLTDEADNNRRRSHCPAQERDGQPRRATL